MDRSELKRSLKALKKARLALDAAKAEYDEIQRRLKEHMIETGAEEETIDGYVMSYKLIISTGVDLKALKAAMPELCAKYSKVTESRRFTVTLPV